MFVMFVIYVMFVIDVMVMFVIVMLFIMLWLYSFGTHFIDMVGLFSLLCRLRKYNEKNGNYFIIGQSWL